MSDHPMLTQAIANLQALEAEMRTPHRLNMQYVAVVMAQCWVDKLGTVIADLQEASVSGSQRNSTTGAEPERTSNGN